MHCRSMGCMCAAHCELPLLNSLTRHIGPALQVTCFPFRCEYALLGWSTRISTHERVRDFFCQKTLHCLREFDCVESRHAQGLSFFDDTGPIVLHVYFEYFSLSNSVLRWILLLTCFQSWCNDCPPSWSYLSDTCIGQAKNPGPRVSFGIVNPTAVHGKSEVLSQLNCDVLICAETCYC